MNDPHVEALIYVIDHDSTVSYKNATPIEFEHPEFRVRVEDGHARFDLTEHYATAGEARAAVQPFIDQWIFRVSLDLRPDQFGLRFERSEMIDRDPTPGATAISAHTSTGVPTARATIRVGKQYPHPPFDDAMDIHDSDVATMHYRFMRYREKHEELSSMAYFCLTMLEYRFKGNARDKAAKHFRVDRDVLNNIGRLTGDKSGKGGRGARKAIDGQGVPQDYSPEEKLFLEHAVRHLILQAARAAAPSNVELPTVTMADLPPLPTMASQSVQPTRQV